MTAVSMAVARLLSVAHPADVVVTANAAGVGCGSSGVTSGGAWNDRVGVAGLVDSASFLRDVVCPVVVEVAVGVHGS